MEFVFDVDAIQEAMSLIFDLAPAKSSTGDPPAIKIESFKETGLVKFGVYEPDSVIIYDLKADVRSSGEAVVVLPMLYKAVTGFVARLGDSNGTDAIKFSLGRQTLTLTASAFYGGKKTNQRRSLSLLDFIPSVVSPPDFKDFVSLSCDLVTQALRKVLFSIPAGVDEGTSTGTLFYTKDNLFKVVSTNGTTLTEFKYDLEKSYDEHECKLASTFVSKLARVLSKISPEIEGEPNVRFHTGKNVFWLNYKGLLVGSPVQNSKFPKYDSIIKGKDKKFVVKTDILLDNVRNILFNSDKDDNFRVTLTFMENEFSIASPTCSNEGLPLEAGRTNLRIDFNAHLLEGAVKNLGSKLFIFSYSDRNSPVIFEPYESELDIMSVVAPLK